MKNVIIVANRDDWPHLQRLVEEHCKNYEARDFTGGEENVAVRLDIVDLPPNITAELRKIEKTYTSVVPKKTSRSQPEETL